MALNTPTSASACISENGLSPSDNELKCRVQEPSTPGSAKTNLPELIASMEERIRHYEGKTCSNIENEVFLESNPSNYDKCNHNQTSLQLQQALTISILEREELSLLANDLQEKLKHKHQEFMEAQRETDNLKRQIQQMQIEIRTANECKSENKKSDDQKNYDVVLVETLKEQLKIKAHERSNLENRIKELQTLYEREKEYNLQNKSELQSCVTSLEKAKKHRMCLEQQLKVLMKENKLFQRKLALEMREKTDLRTSLQFERESRNKASQARIDLLAKYLEENELKDMEDETA